MPISRSVIILALQRDAKYPPIGGIRNLFGTIANTTQKNQSVAPECLSS